MIKILFPAGGYGTYLARCLYSYTNLNDTNTSEQFEFDLSGSSHILRENTDAKTKIWQGHLTSPDWKINNNDSIIVVLPEENHYLDYYNNQFAKNYNYELVKYISFQLSSEEINDKLKKNWGYDYSFDVNTPRWILREFFSLWIIDCFNNGYSLDLYKNIPTRFTIDTQDIILNFSNSFDKICQKLDLKKLVNDKTVIQNHTHFLQSQRYHNSQLNCKQWVQSTIEKTEMLAPHQTIFDEAYIQHIFRTLGYEIKCDVLDQFPCTTFEMQKLIYKID